MGKLRAGAGKEVPHQRSYSRFRAESRFKPRAVDPKPQCSFPEACGVGSLRKISEREQEERDAGWICFPPLLLWGAERRPLQRESCILPEGSSPCEAGGRGRERSELSVGATVGSGESWNFEPERWPSCTQPLLPFCHPRASNKGLIKGFSLLRVGGKGEFRRTEEGW